MNGELLGGVGRLCEWRVGRAADGLVLWMGIGNWSVGSRGADMERHPTSSTYAGLNSKETISYTMRCLFSHLLYFNTTGSSSQNPK